MQLSKNSYRKRCGHEDHHLPGEKDAGRYGQLCLRGASGIPRPDTALLVIDMQNGFLNERSPLYIDGAAAAILRDGLLERKR